MYLPMDGDVFLTGAKGTAISEGAGDARHPMANEDIWTHSDDDKHALQYSNLHVVK